MPTRIDVKKLCRDLGRKPFEELSFKNNHAKCPFHNGDTDTSLSIKEGDDSVWRITCHSECRKSWSAIDYVMQRQGIQFLEAIKILGGKSNNGSTGSLTTEPNIPKTKPKAMTADDWNSYGRELTPDDIVRFAKSRKHKTADFETFKWLGCRVNDDCLAFPHFKTVYDPDTGESDVEFYVVKLRHLDKKEFDQQHSVSQKEFFNLDTVNALEDIYVVEGEPDVAVMEEAGFRAVCVVSGSQKKFSKAALRTLAIAPRIFLIGDQGEDDPGQACMDELQKQDILLPEKTFRIRFGNAHDVCELARKTGEGFASHIIQLREDSLESWVRTNLPTISKLSQEPVRWIIDRLLPYGCLTMLVGSQGSMKSILAMYASQAVSSAPRGPARSISLNLLDNKVSVKYLRSFLGREVQYGVPVLYVDRENPEAEVSNRERAMGILGNQDFIYWTDTHAGEPTPEIDDPRLMEFARRENGLIVFDSLQDWYGDENENDNSAMVKLLGKFRKLARAGAGVLLLHHKNAAGERARGGTSITNLTDMAIKAGKREGESNVVELREERFRMCEAWEIDVKAHWTVEMPEGRIKHYQLQVLRDQLASDVLNDKKEGRRVKAQEKANRDSEDTDRVIRSIQESGNAPSTLGNKLSMNRDRVVKLAAQRGVTWDVDSKSWQGLDLVDVG